MGNPVKSVLLTAAVFLAPPSLLPTHGQEKADSQLTNHGTLARTFIEQLSKGDFANAAKPFDAAMRGALPPDKLEATWKSQLAQAGAFKKQGGSGIQKAGKYEIVRITC